VEIKGVSICASRRPALRCLRQLHQHIMDHHGEKFVSAAQAADTVSSNVAEGGASALAAAADNVMDLMMQLSNTKARDVAANKVALEAEQAKDALEKEVQALKRAMKRPRTEASSTKNVEGTSGAGLYSLNTDSLEGGHVHCSGSSRYQAAQRVGG